MDEPSDAIGGDVELHSMMNAAPTMEEATMEETISTTEPETTQPETTSAVTEHQVEETQEQQAIDPKHEISVNPEVKNITNDSNNVHKNSSIITNLNDLPTILNNHHHHHQQQQQDGAYNSCILSQSSVDAQMEKVIDNIVELSGQFAPNLEHQEGLIDKDKEVEHIQREIIGERNVAPDNPTPAGGVDHHEKPEQAKSSSNIEKPALIESLPQLPDLTKLAHEIVPEISTVENASCLKMQETDQEKLIEKNVALEKIDDVVHTNQDPQPPKNVDEPQTTHSNSVSETMQPRELAKDENLPAELSSSSSTKQDEVSKGESKEENDTTGQAKETTRKEQEEIEELEQLAKESEQKSEDNSMVEDGFSVGNQKFTPEAEHAVVESEKPTSKETESATVDPKHVEEIAKPKEVDPQTRSGRPVRAVRNRTSTRLASPEEPKIKPEKRQNKRTHDQMERDAPAKSSDQVIKAPIKLTLRPASSRTTISTSAPSKRVEKPIKKPAVTSNQKPIHRIIDETKKYNCGDCSFSTDRLNNIVYHKQKVCQHTFEVFNAQVEDWKKTLSSPKSNSKRFSR